MPGRTLAVAVVLIGFAATANAQTSVGIVGRQGLIEVATRARVVAFEFKTFAGQFGEDFAERRSPFNAAAAAKYLRRNHLDPRTGKPQHRIVGVGGEIEPQESHKSVGCNARLVRIES